MAATPESLTNVPLFRDLPRKSLERIARALRTRTFKSGDTIFKEGEEGVGFFMVGKGRVEASRGGTQLAVIGAGGFFGEMALIDNHRRSATMKALEDTECYALMRADFLSEVRENPDLAIEMLQILSRRVRDLDERISQLSH
jgi:CRP-like cAMP-binding protein